MEQQTENANPTLATVMPAYIRERMQQASHKQTATELSTQPEQPTQHVEQEEQSTNDNEASAWKGRLTKEQSAHKDTQARLLAETQARQALEQEKETANSRISALENELATLRNGSRSEYDEELSDEEIEEIELALGTGGRKIVERLKNKDIGKVVDEKLSAERSRLSQQTRETQWQDAVMRELPDMQGLMNNPAFFAYCNETEIDFMGNNAVSLINQAAKDRDVTKIPKIRTLIDNFKQKQGTDAPSETVTAPPSNHGAAIRTQVQTGKKKMTAKDVVHKNRLARAGKTDELREFLAQFK